MAPEGGETAAEGKDFVLRKDFVCRGRARESVNRKIFKKLSRRGRGREGRGGEGDHSLVGV